LPSRARFSGRECIKEIEKKTIEILAERLDIAPEKIKPESNLVEDLGGLIRYLTGERGNLSGGRDG